VIKLKTCFRIVSVEGSVYEPDRVRAHQCPTTQKTNTVRELTSETPHERLNARIADPSFESE
jgi:hypothetical protein